MSTLVMENDAQDYYGGQIGPGLTCGDWGPDISIQTLSVNIIICISNETWRGKVEIDFSIFPFPATHHLAHLKVVVVRMRWNRPDKEIEYRHLSVIQLWLKTQQRQTSGSTQKLERGAFLFFQVSDQIRRDTFVMSCRKMQAVSLAQNELSPRNKCVLCKMSSFQSSRWQSDIRDTWVYCYEPQPKVYIKT